MNSMCRILAGFALCIAAAFAQSPSSQEVKVTFYHVPPAGMGSDSRGNIDGGVIGLKSPGEYKVVLYAHTDQWYVQPLDNAYYTALDTEGKWANWTHLGDRYAAVVVRPSYKPDKKTQALPPVGGDVIAEKDVPASEK